MIGLISSMVLVALASLCNALSDTLSHHWNSFRWKDDVMEQYWRPEKSWKNKYEYYYQGKYYWYWRFVWFSDMFHLLKSAMIALLCIAIAVSPDYESWYMYVTMTSVYGFIWNVFFSFGYKNWFTKQV